METTVALWKWASIQSSNSTPTMPEGMMAAMTLNHSCHVCFFSPSVFRGENGLSLWKNRTITARIAPSWMTTSNMLRNSSETFRVMNSFSKIKCPVEEIGSHSVTPSTMPKSTAFNSSIKSVSFFQFKAAPTAPRFSAPIIPAKRRIFKCNLSVHKLGWKSLQFVH